MLWFGAKQRTCYCGYPSFCSGWVIKGKYDEGDAFSHYAKTCKTSVSWEIKYYVFVFWVMLGLEEGFD